MRGPTAIEISSTPPTWAVERMNATTTGTLKLPSTASMAIRDAPATASPRWTWTSLAPNGPPGDAAANTRAMKVGPAGARNSASPHPRPGIRTMLAARAPRKSSPLLIVLRSIRAVVPNPTASMVDATNTRTVVLKGTPEKSTTHAL
jgi:hypothetical protein